VSTTKSAIKPSTLDGNDFLITRYLCGSVVSVVA
jgi:hypothetical protein